MNKKQKKILTDSVVFQKHEGFVYVSAGVLLNGRRYRPFFASKNGEGKEFLLKKLFEFIEKEVSDKDVIEKHGKWIGLHTKNYVPFETIKC